IGNFITIEEFRRFVDRYRPLPMVSITQTPGLPRVAVDNEVGMRDLVTHFIEVHGYRRIAFICGPENNAEAALRYRTYADVLAEHNLPFDPNLVAPGAFLYETGIDAMRLLLDERKVEFEAVVAANDWMAFGALEVLEERGIRVPEDVALGGFDDTREAIASHPALTTVRQPIQELGRASMEMLLRLLAGEQVPEQTMLPTKLVVRQSCGCSDPIVVHAAVRPLKRKRKPLPEAVAAQREAILSEMAQAVEGLPLPSSEWAGRLLDAFLEEMASSAVASRPASPSPFLLALDDVLRQAAVVSDQADGWQEAISVMRRYVLPYLTDVTILSRAETIFGQGRVAIGKMVQGNLALQEVERVRQDQVLSYLSSDLVVTVEEEHLLDVVGRRLPQLGFLTFYLSFFDGQEHPAEWSRLKLACDRGQRVEVGADGWRFPTGHLVPDELFPRERRYIWVLSSLSFRENQFGFIILEGLQEGSFYGILARQISGVLQDSLLLKAREEAERALEQAYVEVERRVQERTAELEQQQEENLRLQQEVIEAQRRAIQELSTPIIPVLEGVIVMPLIGSIDTLRARDVTRRLLAGIREHRARVVILDITGVPIVDSGVAAYLNKTIQAARLKGARTIITGVSDAVAETIVDLGIDWSGIETLADLQTGLRVVLARG
ncbi:MAG: substrate-binding domain-containing protein, partial [Anaerolineae bacterium]|nr:substrate-binding domain-containing protein [Anaerolineae bacterium]